MKIEITLSRLPDAPDDEIVAAAGQPQSPFVVGAVLTTPGSCSGTTGQGGSLAAAGRVALANILRELAVDLADDPVLDKYLGPQGQGPGQLITCSVPQSDCPREAGNVGRLPDCPCPLATGTKEDDGVCRECGEPWAECTCRPLGDFVGEEQ